MNRKLKLYFAASALAASAAAQAQFAPAGDARHCLSENSMAAAVTSGAALAAEGATMRGNNFALIVDRDRNFILTEKLLLDDQVKICPWAVGQGFQTEVKGRKPAAFPAPEAEDRRASIDDKSQACGPRSYIGAMIENGGYKKLFATASSSIGAIEFRVNKDRRLVAVQESSGDFACVTNIGALRAK